MATPVALATAAQDALRPEEARPNTDIPAPPAQPRQTAAEAPISPEERKPMQKAEPERPLTTSQNTMAQRVGELIANANLETLNRHIFLAACEKGFLDIAKWLSDKEQLKQKLMTKGFCRACRGGQLEVAKWFLGLQVNPPRAAGRPLSLTKASLGSKFHRIFVAACQSGQLEVARWLCDSFSLTRGEAVANKNSAFRKACKRGHFEVVQWLHETFAITRKEVTADGSRAFWGACTNGQLLIAQWLCKTFGIAAADLEAPAILLVATHAAGKDSVVSWLLSVLRLSREEVLRGVVEVAVSVQMEQRVEDLRWLQKTFAITKADVTTGDYCLLCNKQLAWDIKSPQLLEQVFGISQQEINGHKEHKERRVAKLRKIPGPALDDLRPAKPAPPSAKLTYPPPEPAYQAAAPTKAPSRSSAEFPGWLGDDSPAEEPRPAREEKSRRSGTKKDERGQSREEQREQREEWDRRNACSRGVCEPRDRHSQQDSREPAEKERKGAKEHKDHKKHKEHHKHHSGHRTPENSEDSDSSSDFDEPADAKRRSGSRSFY